IPDSSVKRLMELRKWVEHPTPWPISLTLGRPATASNTYHNDPQWSAAKAVDGSHVSRWACDDAVHSAWLEVDLGRDTTFAETYISEAYPNRVQSFEIQRKVGDAWVT